MDDIMEMDLIPSGKPEEDIEAYYDINYENAEFEGERCGICMDVIVDRGVLDCCQHWFCFVCIDNWATITNLCPLCQNEFQLITCVPVYDTIGSNKVDEESFYRDDDWCVEGKSNISFPSYYIDENAVICLDGDGCKIRNGSGLTEGDSDLDTSIACDSCDTWYHAYCVEFDPEDTSESTWLCPRCVTNEQKSSIDDSDPRLNSQFVPVNALVAQGFSRKVSVSVADAGETALVVSMVGGNQVNEEQTDNISSTGKIENFILASEISCQNMPAPSMESTVIVPSLGARELELSLSHDTSVGLTCNSGTHIDLKTSSHKVKTEPISLESISSSRESCYASDSRNQMSKDDFNLGLHLGLPVGTFLSVDDVKSGNKDRVADDKQQNIPLKEHLLQADDILLDKSEETSATIGIKRKYTDCSDHIQKSLDDGSITASPDDVEATTPKLIQGENVSIPLKNHADKSKSDDREGCLSMTLVPKDASSKRVSGKRNVKVDIMGIVRGANRKPSKALVCSNSNDKVSDRQDNLIGLRVKKIMRRAGEDQESSVLVQKLRNEIREAVRNKCSKDFGENLLDTKLLAAFRAAVSGPKTESEKRLSALAVKAKKSILQRGKTRDNLTKKIYGATNGRRKRAWDRDREIEFWKHRCMRATKPEKVATLKSVLDLLRNGSQSPDTKQVSECQSTNPILSRLYLADTSVFPRNDDIKPLSAHKPSFTLEQKKDSLTETSKVSSRPSISLVGNTGNNSSISASRTAAASGKGNHSGHLEASAGSKLKSDKEVSLPSTNARKDKRKWALEVLARKTADACSAAIEKEEDTAVLKGNYPLLAQLPVDMRPELAPSRHNKVPISIRQAQLYRLAEQFLKKANLPIMRRTAETELAIADAVNIEKEVADRSSSKLVYLNLCSQEILHRSDTTSRLSTAVELDCSSPTNVPVNGSELATELEHDPVIQEALRNAGLLSDSPLNSPSDDLNEGDSTTTKEFRVEEPDNVIEMNVHPDVDIYGDFEYDPEEENHFTTKAKTTEVPKPPDEGESKVKVILSTLNAERLISAPDVELSERLENVELVKDASCSPKSPTDVGIGTAPLEGETEEHSAVSVDPLLSKEVHEPSLAEYEELYGPETDPSIKKLPGEALTNDHVTTSELVSENKDYCNNGNSLPVQDGEESAIKYEDKVNGTVVNTCSNSSGGEGLPNRKEKLKPDHNQHSASINTVAKKVETYIKEHIRPLCKSGVITAEQYRWAVQKTTEKVMKYHSKDKNANFLIKEGEKVKKLAEQYVETAQRKGVVD